MDRGTLSGLLQIAIAVIFLSLFVWLMRRRARQMAEAAFAFTPQMVEPHSRLLRLARDKPQNVWLYTQDGYRLLVALEEARRLKVYRIERLTPDTWMLVPGERAIHESFLVAADRPPVYRRLRPLHATETDLRVADEKPVIDPKEFRKDLLPAMIVEPGDLDILADQLEQAHPRE